MLTNLLFRRGGPIQSQRHHTNTHIHIQTYMCLQSFFFEAPGLFNLNVRGGTPTLSITSRARCSLVILSKVSSAESILFVQPGCEMCVWLCVCDMLSITSRARCSLVILSKVSSAESIFFVQPGCEMCVWLCVCDMCIALCI